MAIKDSLEAKKKDKQVEWFLLWRKSKNCPPYQSVGNKYDLDIPKLI